MSDKKVKMSTYINIVIVFIFMFGFGYLPPLEPITPLGIKIVGIFLGLLYGWTLCGMIWPSLLGMLALSLSGAMNINDVLSGGMGNSNTLLIFFLLIFAATVESAGVSKIMAMWFVTRKSFWGKPWLFTFVFLLGAFILSATVSTIAAIIICWGIFSMIAKSVGYKPGDAWPALIVLGIVYSCTLGQCLFPFKAVPIGLLGIYSQLSGSAIPFAKFVAFTTPICILSLVLFTFLGKFVFRPNTDLLKNINDETFGEDAKLSLNTRQKIVLGFLVAMIILMLVPTLLPSEFIIAKILNTIGTTGIIILIVIVMMLVHVDGEPLLNFRQMVNAGMQWEVVILTAVVMPFANVLTSDATGIKTFLQELLVPIFSGKPEIFFCIIVAFLAIVFTNLFNNGVTGMVFLTITYGFVMQMAIPSEVIALLIIFSVHLAILTPAASPMAAMLHGNKEWIGTKQIYKYGAISVLITGVLLIVIGLPWANILF